MRMIRIPSGLVFGALCLTCSSQGLGAAFVKNPSFESNWNETWPHYGAVDEWAGASGVNDLTLDAGGPFHNRGTSVPDRERVGFKQGGGDVTQEISGLTAGETYWVQFYYDGRRGGGAAESLIVKFGDEEIGRVADLKPSNAGYYFMSAPFKPASDSGTLRFTHIVSGDRTVLLDGVTIVARSATDIVLKNPSFEASGILPGVGAVANIAGWAQSGIVGVDDGNGGKANNGTIPDQDLVAFVEGEGSISQALDGLIVGNEYEIRLAVNASTGGAPQMQVKVGDAVVGSQAVNPGSYQNVSLKFKATVSDTLLTIGQTKAGAHTLLVDNVRLLGVVKKALPPMEFSPLAREVSPGAKVTYALSVPAEAYADGPVTVRLGSSNRNVAQLMGSESDGTLALVFDSKSGPKKEFSLETLQRGAASINVLEAAKIPFSSTPSVAVVSSFVKNASFESNPAAAFPGYGDILGWERRGGSGLNRANASADPAGPFGDNGRVPDREQVAFIQGAGGLSQEIQGLTPGANYWLQFRYNARNCCGERTIKLMVKFGGTVLAEYADVKPVADAGETAYYSSSIAFKPQEASGLLEFSTEATGDASIVLDAVNIVARRTDEVVIMNPSFEASGSPPGVGYLNPAAMAGWDSGAGGKGINVDGEGPFTDNGDVPDQDRAGFVQGTGANLSQMISGLVAGQQYTLVFAVNARNCCGGSPIPKVSVDDQVLLEEEVVPVRARNLYGVKYLPFKPAGPEALLKFEIAGPAGVDVSLLLDDVHIVPGTKSAPQITAQPTGVSVEGGQTIELTAAASGSDLKYEWRRNGITLKNDARISGADTTKLTIKGAKGSDAGTYLFVVTDGLGMVGSEEALVEVAENAVPKLIVTRSGNNLTITSEPQPLPTGFILQLAPTVLGPWVDQAGANTPITVPLGNQAAQFLRARKP